MNSAEFNFSNQSRVSLSAGHKKGLGLAPERFDKAYMIIIIFSDTFTDLNGYFVSDSPFCLKTDVNTNCGKKYYDMFFTYLFQDPC